MWYSKSPKKNQTPPVNRVNLWNGMLFSWVFNLAKEMKDVVTKEGDPGWGWTTTLQEVCEFFFFGSKWEVGRATCALALSALLYSGLFQNQKVGVSFMYTYIQLQPKLNFSTGRFCDRRHNPRVNLGPCQAYPLATSYWRPFGWRILPCSGATLRSATRFDRSILSHWFRWIPPRWRGRRIHIGHHFFWGVFGELFFGET